MAKAKPTTPAFTRSELILLYTVVTSRVAMLSLNPDQPEDAAYRQSLVDLSRRIENRVKESSHG